MTDEGLTLAQAQSPRRRHKQPGPRVSVSPSLTGKLGPSQCLSRLRGCNIDIGQNIEHSEPRPGPIIDI